MKITPISYFPTRTSTTNKLENRKQTKINNTLQTDTVSFTGLPAVKTPTLADKISNMFDILHSNEVLLVGKNFKQAVKDLQTHIETLPSLKNVYSPFKKVIKKIFFLEDKTINGTMAFSSSGKKEYTNLGKDTTWIFDGKERYFVKPHETAYVNKQDAILTYDGLNINFKTAQQLAPNKIKNEYVMVVDKTKEAEGKIQQINKRILQQLTTIHKPKRITFKDIGGMDSAIQEVKETIVYPLKYPELRTSMSKAVLLEGPPGTGKSLLAEAVANESNANFIHIKGSELDSKYVGESEANVRKIVQQARDTQPTIIFIDEIDAIAKARSGKDVYGEKVLNTWLAEMSQSEKLGDDIYYIAATNNVASLDNAMTRAGRFGKIIHIGEPDKKGVEQIFNIYKKNVVLDKDFNLDIITELHNRKATGADIATSFEDAKKFAMRRAGIYEKLENGTYTSEDMKNLTIKNQDFEQALKELDKRKSIQGEKDILSALQDEIEEYKALNKERREWLEKIRAQQDFKNRRRIGFKP